MHLLRSLHLKVATGIVGTVALLFAIYLVWDYQLHRKQFLAELEDSAGSISKVISNGLIEVEMVGQHPEFLQASIEQFGNDPSIAGIYLLDNRGTVRFSSRPMLNGHVFLLADEGCRSCHAAEDNKPSSTFVEQSGTQVLRNVVAIHNRRQCQGCHSARNRLNGILIVDLGVERMKSKLRGVLNEMLIKAAMTILATLAVLGILMRRLVITRLKKLTAVAGMLAEERETPAPRALEGPDEIGQLGATFNRMVTSLDQYRRDVRAKEQLRGLLLEKIVRIQEEERRRISRELHDHVGQSLTALLLECRGGDGDPQSDGRDHELLRARIRGLIDEVHQLAWEMRPSILDDYGLDSALQTYVDDTARHCAIPIDYQSSSTPGMERLPAWVEVTLYRIAQEALTNVMRHSRASRASVVLLRQLNSVILLVEDDGCGFDHSLPQSGHKGLGLIGMRERANLCGGSFMIESALTCGTTIRVKIPLEEGSHENTHSDRR